MQCITRLERHFRRLPEGSDLPAIGREFVAAALLRFDRLDRVTLEFSGTAIGESAGEVLVRLVDSATINHTRLARPQARPQG